MQTFPTLLVIDEVAGRKDSLRAALSRRWPGISWREAETEDDLRGVFSELRPELVLIQEELSWINGAQLVSIVLTKWPDCRVVLYAARSEAELGQRWSSRTAVGCHVLSSLDRSRFVSAVSEIMASLLAAPSVVGDGGDPPLPSAEMESELGRELGRRVSEGIMVMSWPGEQTLYANPALCQLLGYSLEELRARTLHNLHPKDQVRWIKEAMTQTTPLPDLEGKELRCLRKDGTERYAEVRPGLFVVGGREHLFLLYRDVTERRLQERKFRDLADALPGAMDAASFWSMLVAGGSRTFDGATFFVASSHVSAQKVLEVLAAAGDERFPSQGMLPVEGEPWTELFRRRLVGQAKAVRKEFPRSITLQTLEAEAFLGLPVHDARGELAGVIAVISRHPLTKLKTAKAFLQIYATLAAQRFQAAGAGALPGANRPGPAVPDGLPAPQP